MLPLARLEYELKTCAIFVQLLISKSLNIWTVCLIFAYLGRQSILMLCKQAKLGEDGVLTEYLPRINLDTKQ